MQHLKSYFMTQMFFWNNNEEGCSVIHLIQYILVQVRHVTLTGNWAIIIIPEVLLQSDWIMRDTQDCAQVVRQHLKNQIEQEGNVFEQKFKRETSFITVIVSRDS